MSLPLPQLPAAAVRHVEDPQLEAVVRGAGDECYSCQRCQEASRGECYLVTRMALQTSHTALVAGPHLEGQFTGVTGVFVVLLVLPMLLVLLWCY